MMLVGVTNASRALMDRLVGACGGSVCLHHSSRGECAADCVVEHVHTRSECYGWQLTGERAAIVVRAALPFLVVKGERACVALAEWDASLGRMQRPGRRRTHIERNRIAMRELGWAA